MLTLNIQLQSLQLVDKIIHQNDKIRVSITTIPEKNKQSYEIEAKKMKDINHFFSVNITKQTEKILFVFRKKNYIEGDPIVASSVLLSKNFPKSTTETTNTEIKHFKLYEHIRRQDSKDNYSKYNNKIDPRVNGQMTIQLTIDNFYQPQCCAKNSKSIYKDSKKYNGYGYSKINSIDDNYSCLLIENTN